MNLKYLTLYLLPVATLISLSVLPRLSSGCGGDSGCPDLDDLETEVPDEPCGCSTCPCMPPMMPPMPPNPLTALAALAALPAAILAAAGAVTQTATIFAAAAKKLKKQKKMEKKAAKKMYKRGMSMLMARMMSGQMPQPTDFMSSRNTYSTFVFPQEEGFPDIPQIIPGPDDLTVTDYVKLFKTLNKHGKGKSKD